MARRDNGWQVVMSSGGTVAGYDPETGTLQWEVTGIVRNTVPSPTITGSLMVIGSGSKGSNLAFDLKGGPEVRPGERWRSADATCGFASPLAYQGRVYFLSKVGVRSCVQAATGTRLFEERVGDGGWASPIAANGRIYVFGEKGATTVLAAHDSFRPLATNNLGFAKTVCGVAASSDALLLRAYEELVCIRAGDRAIRR